MARSTVLTKDVSQGIIAECREKSVVCWCVSEHFNIIIERKHRTYFLYCFADFIVLPRAFAKWKNNYLTIYNVRCWYLSSESISNFVIDSPLQVKKNKKYQEQFLEIQTKVASQKQPVVQHDGVGVSPPTNISLLHKKKNTLLLTFWPPRWFLLTRQRQS